jgi:hypothetical protein
MASLSYLLSGSVDSMDQLYWIDSYQDVQDGKWQSILTSKEPYRTVVINEMSGFAKDDWKITQKLTLNLGLRWEYCHPTLMEDRHNAGGFGQRTVRLESDRLGGFDHWLVGGNPIYLSGYGSSVPASNAFNARCSGGLPTSNATLAVDYIELFGPAVLTRRSGRFPRTTTLRSCAGFCVSGLGRMTVRGGYQITYSDTRNRNTSTLPRNSIGHWNNPNTTHRA